VVHLKQRAWHSCAANSGIKETKVGNRLQEGYWVQTGVELDCRLDLAIRNSITVRLYPGSFLHITALNKDQVDLKLRAGRIYVQILEAAAAARCQVSFTNGTAHLGKGLSAVFDSGRVDVREGSAKVFMADNNETTEVPQGYTFDPVSRKIYDLRNFH
jgi:hypothetical protein